MTRRSHGLADPLALGANAERVLRWLERYPLQRARDLLVALAPWEKRTMLYEHLAELEHAHLIEGVRSGSAPGIRLYTLSPLGNALCDYLAAQRSPGCNQQPGAACSRRAD